MDIALCINEFLKGKEEFRDIQNDYLNIVDGQIHTWAFANIQQPTSEELEAIWVSLQSE